jgi:hypothetical protein
MKSPQIRWLARIAGGAAVAAALLGASLVQPVAAQDDTIVHTAGGSTLIVSPGNASAISAVAEVHASPGHAEAIGAAARAIADCEDGALAEGAAALAVAHPDEGALVESAAVEMVAAIQDDVEAQIGRDIFDDEEGDDDSPVRKIVENECGKDDDKKEPPKKDEPAPAPEPAPEPEVVVIPDTGAGGFAAQGLSAFFAVASMVAAGGFAALRRQR